jgi:hypothetical protein
MDSQLLISMNEPPLDSMGGLSMSNAEYEMWVQFHKLWTKDAINNATTGYDKKEWLELERRIMVALKAKRV